MSKLSDHTIMVIFNTACVTGVAAAAALGAAIFAPVILPAAAIAEAASIVVGGASGLSLMKRGPHLIDS